MRYPVVPLALVSLLALGCEGVLTLDTPGGGGSGGPHIEYDGGSGVWLDGGAPPHDAGPGAAPGCSLPAEGVCDGAFFFNG
ncbi:MAG: hypothetical protein KC586_22600, partial [Myxococcales bacterium]|nr:hypothetical protein [Myxococcales bacterium]